MIVVLGGIFGWGSSPPTTPRRTTADGGRRRPRRRRAATATATAIAVRRRRRRDRRAGTAAAGRGRADGAHRRRDRRPERPRRCRRTTPVTAPDGRPGPARKGVTSHATSTGLSNEKLAMWVFLGSDCLLFGGLISTYLLLRHRSVVRARAPGRVRHPVHVGVEFVLLMSSLTMALAVGPSTGATSAAARIWLLTTALLGSTVHRRPGLRVHHLRQGGPGLHHQHLRLGLLHAHRLPRRARQRRHHHAAVAVRDVAAGQPGPETGPRPSRSSASTGTSSTSCGS